MTGLKKIDYAYFEWLVSQVWVPKGRTYNELFERMHNLEFVWMVPNDDNRIADGLDLRTEFLNGTRGTLTLPGATLLEVLVSLSRRVTYASGTGSDPHWAWKLIKNLRLSKMSDPLAEGDRIKIDDILYALVWREYRSDGLGGFFPLQYPEQDQTKVEIWFQMNKYIIEMNPL